MLKLKIFLCKSLLAIFFVKMWLTALLNTFLFLNASSKVHSIKSYRKEFILLNPLFWEGKNTDNIISKSHSFKLSSTLNDCRKSVCTANNIIIHLEGSAALLVCHRPSSGLICRSVIPLTSVQTAALALPRRSFVAENSKKTKSTKKRWREKEKSVATSWTVLLPKDNLFHSLSMITY